MKKKIIIYGVFVTLLFCLIVSSIYAFVALGKKPINDIENIIIKCVGTHRINI